MTDRMLAQSAGGEWLRRLPAYLYVVDLIAQKRVLEVGCGTGMGAEFLANHGAAHVVGVDSRPDSIDIAMRTCRRSNLELRCEPLDAIEIEDATFDCVFVADGARVLRRTSVLEELRRLLAPNGYLVLSTKSADRPSAVGGASYYEVVDRLSPLFPPVRMVAQAPFVAMSLVEYAQGPAPEPGIELDTSLASAGNEPETTEYLAVCGGRQEQPRGFAIVQLPTSAGVTELAAAAGLLAPPPALSTEDLDARAAAERVARAEEEARRARTVAESLRAALAETEAEAEAMRAQLGQAAQQSERDDRETVSEMVAAALAEHEALVRELDAALDERQADNERLEEELLRVREAQGAALAEARARIAALEREAASWRERAVTAEGKVLKLEAELSAGAPASSEEIDKLAAALSAAEEKVERVSANWREAEAKKDEVWRRVGELQAELEKAREDQVENAARQRKTAQTQLTRAMEEASKKLVSVKDDLLRAERARDAAELRVADGERERKDLLAKLSAAQAREGELSRRLADAEARVRAAQNELARRHGVDIAPEVEARLSLVADRLNNVERALTSERQLIGQLETALTGLLDRASETEPADDGWAGLKEQQLRSFATELGTKDAELALLHVGLSSVRERLREVVSHVREARRAMEGQSAPEMLALMDRLASKLSVYEGMG